MCLFGRKSRSYISQGQFEFDIHEDPDLEGVVFKYEVDPFINNKIIVTGKTREFY
jgi:hypothetical protein